ncbi:hypothetical protein ASD81_20975 [Nocardioides sp. Root614]|nr:hypothetical protein ASD81_20975 [Nocardioides sp. Root614]KRA88366.1 hypothetical protein ASD84_20640 [Nocardioides sp. Root682]
MFLPGTLFWVLVILAATTEDDGYVAAAFAVGGAGLALFAVLKVRESRVKRLHRDRAISSGTRTTARIVATRVRGSLNNDPYVIFTLDVDPESGEPYRVELTELVSQLAIPRILPDTVIDVWVHPDDPQYVVIDPAALGRG